MHEEKGELLQDQHQEREVKRGFYLGGALWPVVHDIAISSVKRH